MTVAQLAGLLSLPPLSFFLYTYLTTPVSP